MTETKKTSRQVLVSVAAHKVFDDLLPTLVRLQRRNHDYKKKSKYWKQQRVSEEITRYARAVGGEEAEKKIHKLLLEVSKHIWDSYHRLRDLSEKIHHTLWAYADNPAPDQGKHKTTKRKRKAAEENNDEKRAD